MTEAINNSPYQNFFKCSRLSTFNFNAGSGRFPASTKFMEIDVQDIFSIWSPRKAKHKWQETMTTLHYSKSSTISLSTTFFQQLFLNAMIWTRTTEVQNPAVISKFLSTSDFCNISSRFFFFHNHHQFGCLEDPGRLRDYTSLILICLFSVC